MRLIDADALIERYGEPCHSFADVIEDMPTIDAVPVVHGHWLEGWRSFPVCSVCREMIATSASSYCPSCGAKMNAKEREENEHKKL